MKIIIVALGLLVTPALAQSDIQSVVREADNYRDGVDVVRDEARAAELYGEAARMGDARAMHQLGLLYWDGRGVEQDEMRAVLFFRDAVARSYAPAMTSLGIAYAEGRGVAVDTRVAAGLLTRAAAAGDRPARDYLARHNLKP